MAKRSILAFTMTLMALGVAGCTKDLAELSPGALAPPIPVTAEAEEMQPVDDTQSEGSNASAAAHSHGDCCQCPCHAGGTNAPSPKAEPAAAASEGQPTAEPAPEPATPPTGTIKGTVSATPARLARHVVVFVEGVAGDVKPGKRIGVNQKKMKFLPYFTVVPVGTQVIYYNGDPFPHNVFSPDHGGFNLGTWGQGGARVHRFEKPGVFAILCYMHPGMLSYVAAVPSNHFATVNRSGEFRIDDVPNGEYQLTAWGPGLAPSSKPIRVAGAEVTSTFELTKEH